MPWAMGVIVNFEQRERVFRYVRNDKVLTIAADLHARRCAYPIGHIERCALDGRRSSDIIERECMDARFIACAGVGDVSVRGKR